MSSILKSLKKLEEETDRNLLASQTQVVSSQQTLRRQVASHRRTRLWFFSLIIVCFLAAGGWVLTRTRSVSTPSLPVSSTPPAVVKPDKMVRKTAPPFATPPQRPASGIPATRSPAASPEESRTPGTPSPLERMRQAIVSRSQHSLQNRGKGVLLERPDIPKATAVHPPGKSDQPPSQQEPAKKSAPNPVAPEMTPAPAAASPATPPAVEKNASELPPLSADAGLKLEALAWATAPESRFAVINSQIVREGDIIEGAKVERIEKEQVVLRKEGKLWQLRHRPQR